MTYRIPVAVPWWPSVRPNTIPVPVSIGPGLPPLPTQLEERHSQEGEFESVIVGPDPADGIATIKDPQIGR